MRPACDMPTTFSAERNRAIWERRVAAGDMIASAPLRAAFEARQREEGVTANELARRLNWVKPDGQRVRRMLGLQSAGRGHKGEFVSYENALALCRAMNVDPVEVGL